MKTMLLFAVAGAAALFATTASADFTNGTPELSLHTTRAVAASTGLTHGSNGTSNAATQTLRANAATSHASSASPAGVDVHRRATVSVASTEVAVRPEVQVTGGAHTLHARTSDLATRRATFFHHAHVHAMKL